MSDTVVQMLRGCIRHVGIDKVMKAVKVKVKVKVMKDCLCAVDIRWLWTVLMG